MMPSFHIAQLNIARAVAPLDSPAMAEFMIALDEINALADSAPGFVWRLKSDDGNATSYRPFADPNLLVNLSVWQSVDSLKVYAYQSRHVAFVRRRQEWFESMDQPYLVLWWLQAGHIPTLEQAKVRLAYLTEHGPTPYAFNFQKLFEADQVN